MNADERNKKKIEEKDELHEIMIGVIAQGRFCSRLSLSASNHSLPAVLTLSRNSSIRCRSRWSCAQVSVNR
jgi:hypothetical protein